MNNPITGQTFIPGGGALFRGTVNEDGSATLLNRLCIETNNSQTPIQGEGYPIQQSDIAANGITYGILNLSSGLWVVQAQALVTATVVFNALQQASGPNWIQDTIGYNFRHALPPGSFPTGRNQYRYEAKIVLANGADILWVRWDLLAGEVFTAG